MYELRTVTDWMWTETTLTLSEWIGMEDIFCTVFQLKVISSKNNLYPLIHQAIEQDIVCETG